MKIWSGKSPIRRAFVVLAWGWMIAILVAVASHPLEAEQSWSAWVGAENKDEAKQANAFLPNEIWVLEGDSITWTFVPVNEIHTVTFLPLAQLRPGAFAQDAREPLLAEAALMVRRA